MKVDKVLLIRFSSIGDIVLCSALVRCVKEQSGAEVHFLTKGRFSSVVEANPNIDKVWILEDMAKDLSELKQENYDLILDLHNNLRSSRVKRLLNSKSFTLDKINTAKWLKVNLGLDVLPKRHIVDRKFDLAKDINVYYDGKGLDFFYGYDTSLDKEWKKEGRRTSIVLGAAHFTKRIPEGKIIELCQEIEGEIFLLGGPSEAALGAGIAEKVNAINLCGKLSLHGSAQLLDSSDVVISSDTGLMHIAAALNKPLFVLWGSTVPEFGMYPFLPTGGSNYYNEEVYGLHCRPCSKIGYQACPKGHFNCMNLQDTKDIAKRVNQKLLELNAQ